MDERKQFTKDIWKLLLPIAFQNLMATLIGATDALVLARVDQYAVAAVSLAGEISFVMNMFLGTIIGGISIMAAQYLGKGDTRTVKNLMGMALRYNLAVAFLFFLGAFFAPDLLMRLYTSDANLAQIGAGYLRIASWSYLLSAIAQCYLCIMRATNAAGVCALIATLTAVVDVVVDIVLVYGLDMGAKGTAISTVAVCAVELIGVMIYTSRGDRIRPDRKALTYYSRELEGDFWRITIPVLISYLVWGCGYSLSAAIMGHVSADASSAYAIAALIRNLFSCFIHGLGSGAGILIGKNLGSGDMELSRRNGARICKTTLIFGVVSGLLYCLLSPLAMKFFILNDITREYLRQMTPMVAVYIFGLSISVTIISNLFPAGGDTKFDAQVTGFTMWCITIPVSLLAAFVFHWPVAWIYFCLCLDEPCKAVFVYRRYKQYRWLKNITRDFA